MKALEVLNNHRTYRNFDQDYQLSDGDLQQMLQASCQAPSWMNDQMYSIIVVKDKKYGNNWLH